MGAFEDFVVLELPRRSAFLNKAITGYDDDPNDGGAPSEIQGAPLGTWFREETAEKWWRKTESAWEEQGAGTGGGGNSYQTEGALTLAVNASTGSDTPTETRPAVLLSGDYSSEPFATIQAAINSVPLNAIHTITIDVAAGNYAGIDVRGRNLAGSMYINGTQGTATPATGPASGTATSGTNRSLTLTAAGWTTGDLEGKFIEITSGQGAGQHLIIADNDTDTIRTAGIFNPAPNGTSVFSITEPTTIFTSGTSGVWNTACIGYLQVQDFHINGPSYGCVLYASESQLGLRRVTANGCVYGFIGQDSAKTAWSQIGALSSTSLGIAFLTMKMAANGGYEKGWFVDGGSDGLSITACQVCGVEGVWIKNASNNGLYATDSFPWFNYLTVESCYDGVWISRASAVIQRVEVSGCTRHGISSDYGGRIDIRYTVTGSGNGGWGVHAGLGVGGIITLSSLSATPTITGTNGDCTVDGTTALVWATDFAAAEDYVHDDARMNHLVRV
jgi:hypothetical protein